MADARFYGDPFYVAGGGSSTTNTTMDFLLYGPATDGDLDFDGVSNVTVDGVALVPAAGVYTLADDVLADRCTIRTGATIDSAGYRMLGYELIMESGATIRDVGNNAGGAVAGPGLTGTNATTQRSSGAGGAGRTAANNGLAGSTVSNRILGGAGGNGGNAGAFNGGTGGAVSAPNPAAGRRTAFYSTLTGRQLTAGTAGGAGGGGGAVTGAGTSGAGGSGGGVIFLAFKTINCAAGSTVTVRGGNGSAASAGDGGGGGGGGGGYVQIVAQTVTLAPTVNVSGGTGAAGIGVGIAGTDGAVGVYDLIVPVT